MRYSSLRALARCSVGTKEGTDDLSCLLLLTRRPRRVGWAGVLLANGDPLREEPLIDEVRLDIKAGDVACSIWQGGVNTEGGGDGVKARPPSWL